MGSAIFMHQEKIETRLFGIDNTGNKKKEYEKNIQNSQKFIGVEDKAV